MRRMSDEPDGRGVEDQLLAHPKVAFALAAIAFAVSFSPRVSSTASWVCLAIAAGFSISAVSGWTRKCGYSMRVALIGMVVIVGLTVGFGKWLVAPVKTALDVATKPHTQVTQMEPPLKQPSVPAQRPKKRNPETAVPIAEAPDKPIGQSEGPKPELPKPEEPKSEGPRPPSATPNVITWGEFIKQQEAERTKRHAAEPPEPICSGSDLSRCGNRGLLEWGKPLVERVTKITDALALDMKIAADRFSGDKYFRAVEAGENDAFDSYRQCCAADALRYYEELANRIGGGHQSEEFRSWTAMALQPPKSKDWKTARYGSHIKLMRLTFDFGMMQRELESRETIKHLRD